MLHLGVCKEESELPSKVAQLAAVLTGNGSTGFRSATVQRSHRFFLHHFMWLENMARIADCSVAAMINQVVDVGIDALTEHLPPEVVEEIRNVPQEQVDKANSQIKKSVKYEADK